MRGKTISAVILIALAFQALTLRSADAQARSESDLVGTWTLVSSITERSGSRTEQFGPGAKGMLSFDGRGQFMLTIIGPDLPRFASNNRADGTPEENKAVIGRSIAMIGTYVVDPDAKTLTFKVETATFPNWNATEQRRNLVAVSREELKYVTPTASSGGIGTVTWKRVQ